MKPEKWWTLVDKRGKVLLSSILQSPVLFRTKQEAVNWMTGDTAMLPAPDGTRVARLAVTVAPDSAPAEKEDASHE